MRICQRLVCIAALVSGLICSARYAPAAELGVGADEFDEYYKASYRKAGLYTNCPATRDEIASDAASKTFLSNPIYAPSVLSKATKHTAIDQWRSKTRQKTLLENYASTLIIKDNEFDPVFDAQATYAKWMESRSKNEQDVWHATWGQFSEREIATMLNMKRHVVRSNYANTVASFKDHFGDHDRETLARAMRGFHQGIDEKGSTGDSEKDRDVDSGNAYGGSGLTNGSFNYGRSVVGSGYNHTAYGGSGLSSGFGGGLHDYGGSGLGNTTLGSGQFGSTNADFHDYSHNYYTSHDQYPSHPTGFGGGGIGLGGGALGAFGGRRKRYW